MDTILIIILILILFIYLIKKGIENEKLRQERKRKHWAKIRYIQELAPSTRENIFNRNYGMCYKCESDEKLCFYLLSDNPSDWNENDVILICSECKGYSSRYYYDRKIPKHTKALAYDRDGGRCVNCNSSYDISYDHIIPYSFGGASADADNIQVLCRSCNSSKHSSFKY
jgi:5-methylcytosine-specific restriction endonuclease McrA